MGIEPKYAPTIGIAVDKRRRNKCQESLDANVQRLELYKSKLLIFPKRGKKAKKGDTARSELKNVTQNTLKAVIPVPKPTLYIAPRAITEEEKAFEAYKTLKKARSKKKYD